ncbi:GntR family transcriptional regulator, partial [Sporomusa sp.]|uniref:GntR family transcriptional regulator n=1 Tax=Sporomusa sp. TaxID=2078658 RepID=UPI002BADE724
HISLTVDLAKFSRGATFMSIFSMTKSATIYSEIKKGIINGDLKPGTHLIIKQIADQYGISDIPVREALRELNAEGLVETIPHVGSRVSGFSMKNIEDMLVMRECLEPFAAELTALNADGHTIERLEQYYHAMQVAFQAGDTEKYRDLNREFHKLFVEACGNSLMTKTIIELMESHKRMLTIFQLFPEILEISNSEHGLMIDYLKERNGKMLAKTVYEHKKRAFDKMRNYLQQHGYALALAD